MNELCHGVPDHVYVLDIEIKAKQQKTTEAEKGMRTFHDSALAEQLSTAKRTSTAK